MDDRLWGINLIGNITTALSVSRSLRIQATRANFLGLRTASLTGIGQRVRVNSQANWYRTGGASPPCCKDRSQSAALCESCAGRREAVGEALTAARVGGDIERRNPYVTECRGPTFGRRQHRLRRHMASRSRTLRRRRTQARTYVLYRDLGELPGASTNRMSGPHQEGSTCS